MTLLNGCALLTPESTPVPQNKLKNGCEWVVATPIPEDVLVYAVRSNKKENREFVERVESNNSNWLLNCTVKQP